MLKSVGTSQKYEHLNTSILTNVCLPRLPKCLREIDCNIVVRDIVFVLLGSLMTHKKEKDYYIQYITWNVILYSIGKDDQTKKMLMVRRWVVECSSRDRSKMMERG